MSEGSSEDEDVKVTVGRGVGWPDQPSRHLEPESEPDPTDPYELAEQALRRRGH